MVWEETIVTSRNSALDIMVTRKSVFWKYTKCFLVKNVCEVFIDCAVVSFDVLVFFIGVMSGGRSIDKERKSPRESGEDSEDESEILEESPCGRWLKRREEVSPFHFSNYLVYVEIFKLLWDKDRRQLIHKVRSCYTNNTQFIIRLWYRTWFVLMFHHWVMHYQYYFE